VERFVDGARPMLMLDGWRVPSDTLFWRVKCVAIFETCSVCRGIFSFPRGERESCALSPVLPLPARRRRRRGSGSDGTGSGCIELWRVVRRGKGVSSAVPVTMMVEEGSSTPSTRFRFKFRLRWAGMLCSQDVSRISKSLSHM
jgi:hypothetical protein